MGSVSVGYFLWLGAEPSSGSQISFSIPSLEPSIPSGGLHFADSAPSARSQSGHSGDVVPETFNIKRSEISECEVKEFVDQGYLGDYRLPGDECRLAPHPDEVIVFRDQLISGLMIPCNDFVLCVLRRYRIQLHELAPDAIAHLSKFVRAMTSYGGDPEIEVFVKYFVLRCRPCRLRLQGVVHVFFFCVCVQGRRSSCFVVTAFFTSSLVPREAGFQHTVVSTCCLPVGTSCGFTRRFPAIGSISTER